MSPSSRTTGSAARPLLLCFSHLRWGFVYQRPQHLMTCFARSMDVVFWEEPVFEGADATARLEIEASASGIQIATPRLPSGLSPQATDRALRDLLDEHLAGRRWPVIRWYYTPMMLGFSDHLAAACTVYDCMDELANFRFAPDGLLEREAELLKAADLVFTGGWSLYEAKRDRHPSVHAFPSSVDRDHFASARAVTAEPGDQAAIAHPRLGYYGVIDERLDLDLLAGLADRCPDWSLVMLGPVVKVDEGDLPRRANIHWLGAKEYGDLPRYAAAWDAALMPFALNDATRFISPTKTPEYLAAGLPVVSTPVPDVARSYGDVRGVFVAERGHAFARACEAALELGATDDWRGGVDDLLSGQSWDHVAGRMSALMMAVVDRRDPLRGHYDYLVVGAGFAGSVMAERLAADAGARVLVVDRRPHIAGNAFDRPDDAGILIHQYGPHIFHTNSDDILAYLSRFTDWRPYEHRVLAEVAGKLVPIPINRTTLNELYDAGLTTDEEAAAFLADRAAPVADVRTSADVVVSAVGQELYELFFRGYTRKQWGMDPSELDRSVTARVPTRTNTDDRYFADRHQVMPAAGYTAMFQRMLDHPNITVATGVDYADLPEGLSYDRLVWTGPIDEFFGYRHGRLPYRSLRFEHRTEACEWLQPVAVVNHPHEDTPHTRVTEYKHLTGQQSPVTSVTVEFPADDGDPYYPIPKPENAALYKRYEALAATRPDVLFVGRLATYRYYNMDQVVGQALATYRRHRRALEEPCAAEAEELVATAAE